MKYNCNACGRYVEAGSGHDCYKPMKPRRDVEQLQSLCESYRRDLVRERERIAELEAENKRLWSEQHEAQRVYRQLEAGMAAVLASEAQLMAERDLWKERYERVQRGRWKDE